eukprot:jgi/Mesvir1/18617/Mv17126-RA.1
MFLIVSAVAVAGYLLRPPPVSRVPFSAMDLDSIPPPPQSVMSHPASLGYPLVPNFTLRGGYGPGDPAYSTAPTNTLGFGREETGFDVHVRPPDGHDGGTMFAPGGFPRPSMYSDRTAAVPSIGIPGVDVNNERQPLELAHFQGDMTPDRVFPGQQTWAQNIARERDSRTAPETLNRNFNIPEPRLRVNRPNPQVAHLEQRSLPTTNMGKEGLALRAGSENRPHMAEFETGGRLDDVYRVTVLPERTDGTRPPIELPDAFNDTEAPGWAGCQDHNRTYPKRADTIDATDYHPAPVGDFGVQTLEIGGHVHDVRGPLNNKTFETRISNAEFSNPYQSFRGDQHTRVSANKVFQWRDANAELTPSKEVLDGTQQVARFPKLDETAITAVGRGGDEYSGNAMQEKNTGDRMERPGRVGLSSITMGVGDSSTVAAYSALKTNPYYIPHINHYDS